MYRQCYFGESCSIEESFSLPKIGKWLMPTIRGKEVTYSDPSVKLGIERKYVTELMLVKSYQKGLVFLLPKAIKDITYHFLKLKVFSQ